MYRGGWVEVWRRILGEAVGGSWRHPRDLCFRSETPLQHAKVVGGLGRWFGLEGEVGGLGEVVETRAC